MTPRLAALAVLPLLGVLAWLTGLFELIGDPERARTLLGESGPVGPLLFVLAFGLLEPFGVPGILFVVPATLVWPLWLAFLLSWLGALLAGLVGFGFARWLARDWAREHMPERMRVYDQRLAERGLQTVILVRLLFFLAPPAHWALGLSQVRLAPFVLGTAIGFVPGIAALAFAGKGLFALLDAGPHTLWIVAVVAGVAVFVLLRRLRGVRLGHGD